MVATNQQDSSSTVKDILIGEALARLMAHEDWSVLIEMEQLYLEKAKQNILAGSFEESQNKTAFLKGKLAGLQEMWLMRNELVERYKEDEEKTNNQEQQEILNGREGREQPERSGKHIRQRYQSAFG